MKRPFAFLVFIVGLSVSVVGISQEPLDVTISCSYYGEASGDQLWSFSSDRQAEDAVKRIMHYTGLPQNFEVTRGNVANAMAAISGGTRLIVYNQDFMERVERTTNTDWSSVSILAHEIGHHLAGHTLTKDGSRPRTELEADRFSGHVLFKMGAQLEDAKAAMQAVAGDTGSDTHPPKSARLVAIESGWFDARDQSRPPEESGGGTQTDRNPEQQPERQPARQPARQPVQQQGPVVVAECHFLDGGVSYLMSNNTILMLYMGVQYNVAMRTTSDDSRFEWFYVIQATDAQTEAYLNMMGMSGTTTYGVDINGNIWTQNMYGQLVDIGDVYYSE
jgi:hypothetical protein